MKRPSYRHAIWWIASNDEGTCRNEHDCAYFVTSLLVADIFGVDPERVGKDIVRMRKKFDKEGWPQSGQSAS